MHRSSTRNGEGKVRFGEQPRQSERHAEIHDCLDLVRSSDVIMKSDEAESRKWKLGGDFEMNLSQTSGWQHCEPHWEKQDADEHPRASLNVNSSLKGD